MTPAGETIIRPCGSCTSLRCLLHSIEPAEIIERKGCDLVPIDPTSQDGALSLRSFIWADQLGRLSRLDGAIEVAKQWPLEVEQMDAATFLERELDEPRPDMATVVYHSVVMQYPTEAMRSRIAEVIDAAVCARDAGCTAVSPQHGARRVAV